MIKSHRAIITRQPAQIPTPRTPPRPRPPWIQPWSGSITVIPAGEAPVEAGQQRCRLAEAHDPLDQPLRGVRCCRARQRRPAAALGGAGPVGDTLKGSLYVRRSSSK
ncbi:hypothetical protein Snoj_09070 [Streptomyces nojiriensis]|uniref:Uncharacterized protein n=1 Tax=Streptomyces nojiriensis TaxID=66374 RepID=A0ABQ3SFT9_9ACTN|nr:hypothetical protein [Streptomyces nojiriensis]GGS04077.1 hypothetical protein GCM10010205_36420 [Streptomyces nojiriensis]GHI66989.1 hypothetical protein Snoj_09070 [Streptomyces nojiriensis]